MTQDSRRAGTAKFLGGLMLLLVTACSGGSAPNQSTLALPSAVQPAQDPLSDVRRAPGSGRLQADEHPELAHLTQVSTDSLADAIASYVRSESKGRAGAFPIPNPNGGEPLGLTLTTVHRERVSRLADGRYFACADFTGVDGNTYDVDIFMRAESKGLVPADIIVHKVKGAPRFNWIERDGAWSAVPVSK